MKMTKSVQQVSGSLACFALLGALLVSMAVALSGSAVEADEPNVDDAAELVAPLACPPDVDGVHCTVYGNVYLLVVDLQNPNIHLRTTISNNDQGGGELVRSMAQRHGAVAAVNADYFGPSLWPDAMTYINGTDYTNCSWDCTNYRSSLAVSRSNRPNIGIGRSGRGTLLYNVVSGGPWFVNDGNYVWNQTVRRNPDGSCFDVDINGELFKCDAQYWENNGRQWTAAGISQDGTKLVLAASLASTGSAMKEALVSQGVHQGMKFDGGGSTQMYFNGTDIISSSRAVADAILVIPGAVQSTAPANLSASAAGQNTIHLTWDDTSNNEAGFRVFRDGSQIDTVGQNSTSYDDTDLSCGTSYSYHVKAYNNAGDSDASNTASATTDQCPTPPLAPTLSSPAPGVSLRSCENITLDWGESSGASEYYAEYWGANNDNSGWVSGTDWNIGTRAPGTYYWHVKARNQWGESDWSDPWSLTVNPNQTPNTPSPTSPGDGAWVNTRSLTLQWSTPSDDGCPRGLTYNAQIERITGSSWSTNVSDHSGTSWSPAVPTDDDYRWRVQAYDGELTSNWSGYRTVKVDATPPDTSITDGPQGDIPVGEASFTWTGSDNRTPTGDMVYSYRLRGLSDNWSEWAGSTTVSYSGLPDGDYTFEAKARDLAGNEDSTPASRSFFVDTTPPDTTITSGPSGCIGTADATFAWTGSDNRTPTGQLQYSFWLEGYDAGWSDWSSATSKTYTSLPDGPYTFHVKARDGVGHEDPSPASRAFQVDTTPPTGSVLINGGDGTANQIAVRLDITGDDGPLGCGVTQMRLVNDDHNYKEWRGFEEQINWLLPPVNRTTWTVHLQLKDLVGNVSGAFTDDIYLDFYPPRPASESYQLGARVTAGGDGRPTSESYQLDGTTLGQAVGSGRGRSRWYRLESGFQGAWPSVPRGRPPAEAYDVWDSVTAGSGDAPRSERYRLYGTGGQPVADGVRSSENYQLVSGFWLPAGWDICGDDFDRDGVIGAGDIQRQVAHWRTSMGNRDPDHNPNTSDYEAVYDRNLDGVINVVDVMHLVARWGRRCWINTP